MIPEALDLAVWPIFHRMSTRGLLVDVGRMEALLEEVRAEEETQAVLVCVYAGEEINPASGDSVARWMEKVGLFGKFTKGRVDKEGVRHVRLKTDERELSKHDHPALKALLEFRGLQKLRTTFIGPVLEKVKLSDPPVIHPRWRLTRVKSGRAACEDPNLLAFPNREEIGRKVRSCFIARPGMRMLSVDYSQLEPRMVAALSGEQKLLDIYIQGRDIYAETAKELFQVEIPDPFAHRLPAKVVTLGVLYGIGAERLRDELVKYGCNFFDVEGCEALIDRWFEVYPKVRELADCTISLARRTGWVYTTGGRGRFLPALFLTGERWPSSKLREEAERQAFNHLIQGSAQEETKRGMLRVDAGEPLYEPLLQLHDEIVGEVPEGNTDVVTNVAALMASRVGDVELKTSYKVAGDWGLLK